jgi:hypothetical protein
VHPARSVATVRARCIFAVLAACPAFLLPVGCQLLPYRFRPGSGQQISADVYRRAESERAERLQREVERLRADLQQAEGALVAAESGLLGNHSRADAVSSLAEVRIQVERAAQGAPWRSREIDEARQKLEEADRLVQEGHFGAALFFVYRARRMADQLQAEAREVAAAPGARFVRAGRVNLRAGPSTDEPVLSVLSAGTPVFPEQDRDGWVLVRTAAGPVGWVHHSLLDDGPPASPAR